MPDPASAAPERVLVLTPTASDAILTRTILEQAELDYEPCTDLIELSAKLEQGAGAILLTEGALATGTADRLVAALERQPEWSDVPVLVLAGGGLDAPAALWLMQALGNVTVLDRPVRIITLISALRTAIKARRRQYQLRDQLETIQQTQESLREASQRKDEFLATLAHELRNPLAPISNSLHLLQDDSTSKQLAQRAVGMMSRQLNHMVRLVDDLLEASRITRGNVDLHLEPLELAAVISAALDASRPLIESCEHQLSVTMPNQPVLLHGDPVRLTQIFTNLLNNAAKYTPNGGQISLVAKVEHMEDRDDVVVTIRDNGAGIPDDMLDRVFDMFTQVRRDTEQPRGGLGIGLTLVKSLVGLHGGSVHARPRPSDIGTEFEVRLPVLSRPSIAPSMEHAARSSDDLADRRILVVDDNRDAADTLGMMLNRSGAVVELAYDGLEALRIIDAHRPDVVLLDIGMPGLDGYEVAKQIRARPDADALVIVALTGWGQQEDRQRSRDAGFDHHLVKPVDFDLLFELLSPPKATT